MAHFLIDASLPRPTASLVVSHGYAATDVRDIGMAAASDQQIAAPAQANRMILLTKDRDFGNILDYPLTTITESRLSIRQHMRGASPSLPWWSNCFVRRTRLTTYPVDWPSFNKAGRLAILQQGRIRLRPPP